jgi:hypothetical protein
VRNITHDYRSQKATKKRCLQINDRQYRTPSHCPGLNYLIEWDFQPCPVFVFYGHYIQAAHNLFCAGATPCGWREKRHPAKHVTEKIVVQMNEAATDFPREFDEFEMSGLTAEPSQVVIPPRVKESPINMECSVRQIIEIGPEDSGGAALVIGEIVMFHVADELIDNGRIDSSALNPVGRLAGSEYATLGRRISLKRKWYTK